MARLYSNSKRHIGYRGDGSSRCEGSVKCHLNRRGLVLIDAADAPFLTLRQAEKIARKILTWCDDAARKETT